MFISTPAKIAGPECEGIVSVKLWSQDQSLATLFGGSKFSDIIGPIWIFFKYEDYDLIGQWQNY